MIRKMVNEAREQYNKTSIIFIQREKQFSKAYPDGPQSYFKKRIYEFISEWEQKSMTADTWITAGMNFNIEDNEGIKWLEKLYNVAGKHHIYQEEKFLLEDIGSFLLKYFKIKQLIELRDESTQPQDTGWSLDEIALICIYTGTMVNSKTDNDILKKFNPKFTSGRKLREVYNNLILPINRTGSSGNTSGDRKRIRGMINVIRYLETNNYEADQAKQEMETLQKNSKLY